MNISFYFKNLILTLLVLWVPGCSVDSGSQAFDGQQPTLDGIAPDGYYDDAAGKAGEELRLALHQIIARHRVFSYSEIWSILKETDEDPLNPDNVILFYTGESRPKNFPDQIEQTTPELQSQVWNREHVWPKSRGFSSSGMPPYTDAHHLRPADEKVNATRSNRYFAEINRGNRVANAPGNLIDGSGSFFEPADEFKGDVARMILYMDVRYEGKGRGEPDLAVVEKPVEKELHELTPEELVTFGKLSDLLRWNELDPVDDFERRRNNRVYKWQKNRNPFIDNPEWVEKIWGQSGN